MSTKVVKIPTENTAFHMLSALRDNRSKRHSEGKFVVEGVRSINNAIGYGWEIKGLIYCPGPGLSAWAKGVLSAQPHATRYEVTAELLARLSFKDEASELMAVVAMQQPLLSKLSMGKGDVVLVFDRPSNPGNLGSVIRSADAFGVKAVVISGHAVDPFSHEVITAATGSFFALPVMAVESSGLVEEWLAQVRKRTQGLQVIGTDERGETALDAADLTGPAVVLVGNETSGLSKAYEALADTVIAIPMAGSASSLNAAVATSIVLYEVQRQRR